MNEQLIGSLAGIATSVLWVLTSIFFTEAGRRIGSTVVNTLRLFVAIAIHAITFRLLSGQWFPDATTAQLLYLAASGILGLALCDQALFTAFVDIGPRRSLLAMTTSPVWAAIFGALAMREHLSLIDILAIALTIAGVAWVILERRDTKADERDHPHYARGVVLAFAAAVLQAAGMLFSKMGMGHGVVEDAQRLSPQGATYIRLVLSLIGMAPIIAIYAARRGSPAHAASRARRIGRRDAGYLLTVGGAIVGPYLGVWMSLVALDNTPVGVAQTLCSLSPVFILPFLIVLYKERITPRAVIGALVAVGGSSLLVLSRAG